MFAQPTLIVIASPLWASSPATQAMSAYDWHHLHDLVGLGTQVGLPTLCLLPPGLGAPPPIDLPPSCLLMSAPLDGSSLSGAGIAQAVEATAQSAGWLLLPMQGALPRAATVKAVAEALRSHPMAAPSHGGRRGHPLGLGAEFYSELIRLKHLRDVDRLLARYPHVDIQSEAPLAYAQQRHP